MQRDYNDVDFDSDFESGNLDLVVQKEDDEYDLFMRVDSNTRGHLNWFFLIYLINFKGFILRLKTKSK